VDPADVVGIATAIEGVLREYAAGRHPIASDRGFIDRFDVRAQVSLLDSGLRELLGDHRGGTGRSHVA
jgi:hypothetical protein